MRALLIACALLVPASSAPAQPVRAGQAAEARRAEIDRLFAMLQAAPDEAAAAMIEARLKQLWMEAVSPAARLLLGRGARNLAARNLEEAIEDYDAALLLAPDSAEAWHQRAQALAAIGDVAAAARDLQEALRLEPRHFAALVTLSRLQEQRGDVVAALRSMEAALALHPRMRGGAERLRELRRKAEGEAT